MNRREFAQLWSGIFSFLCGFQIKAEAIEPTDNTGYWQHRIAPALPRKWSLCESALAEEWKKWNEPHPGLNYGHGLLQDLMLGTHIHEKPDNFNPWLTARERKIVATVIQWLGTNIGRSFLYEASARMGVPQQPFTKAIEKCWNNETINELRRENYKLREALGTRAWEVLHS